MFWMAFTMTFFISRIHNRWSSCRHHHINYCYVLAWSCSCQLPAIWTVWLCSQLSWNSLWGYTKGKGMWYHHRHQYHHENNDDKVNTYHKDVLILYVMVIRFFSNFHYLRNTLISVYSNLTCFIFYITPLLDKQSDYSL